MLPRSEGDQTTRRPPCDVCALEALYTGFWGRWLCEGHWHKWRAHVEASLLHRPEEVFLRWLADARAQRAAA
jgi:hypothetical protein